MIRGTTRPVVKKQNIDLRAAIHNRFVVEVYDAATGELKRKARAYNVICDAYWTRLFNTSGQYWQPLSRFVYVLYGKGSGTPAASDTALFSRNGALQINSFEKILTRNRRTGVCSCQAVATLNAEDAVGETITELGIGYDNSHCVTHAMLQDMDGNPISIEKTDTDVIKIYATLYLHWPDGGWYGGAVNFLAAVSGDDVYASFVEVLLDRLGASYSVAFLFSSAGKCTGIGSSVNTTGIVYASINTANKTIIVNARYAAANANGPIRGFQMSTRIAGGNWTRIVTVLLFTMGSWYTPPAISGEAVGTGDGSTTGFATAFPVKTGGTVYVDGVAASGVSVHTGPAAVTNMEQWFNRLNAKNANALTESGTPIYANSNNLNGDYLDTTDLSANATTSVYENPFFALGLAKFQAKILYANPGTLVVQASDDCETWADVCTISGNNSSYSESAVPAAYKNKKYWRFKNTTDSSRNWMVRAVGAAADEAHNIVFDTAPAAGAVITCDYVPDCIAKDSNHVLDLSVTLTLGEYQE